MAMFLQFCCNIIHHFRHLSTQLDGLKDAISTMLQHEFVKIVQHEFAKPLNNENDMNIDEVYSIVLL